MPFKICHFDLETIPNGNPDDIEISVPKTYKDPVKIEKYIEENREKQFRDRSKNPATADIIVLSAAFDIDEIESFVVDPKENITEKELLEDFQDWLIENLLVENEEGTIEYTLMWAGFNIREYDLQILYRKALKYRLYPLAKMIPRKRYDNRVIDIMEIWTGGSQSRGGNTMKDVREYLGMDGKTAGMDGSMVYGYYLDGRINDIVFYCESDVSEEHEIFEIMKPTLDI